MKRTCNQCGKEFGFFDIEFKCRGGCKGTYCSDCMISPRTEKIRKEIKYLSDEVVPQKIETEWSIIKFKDVACIQCVNSDYRQIEKIHRKYIDALIESENIDCFPATFKGKINFENSSIVTVNTNYFKDRSDAEKCLKVMAAFYGNNLVFDNRWEKKTESEPGSGKGTHYYTVWRGVAKTAKTKTKT